jgi:hypothetical protein
MALGVDSASNRNKYLVYFLGVKRLDFEADPELCPLSKLIMNGDIQECAA